MNTKYLAYIALLAGWICFCYWLYARAIYPQWNKTQEKSWPEYSEDLPYPIAFSWASDIPLTGPGFGELMDQLQHLDSTNEMVIVRGYYFRDEADSIKQLQSLGKRRINNAIRYLDLDRKRIVVEVLPQEINADVRSNHFEALRFERIDFSEIISLSMDTFEVCFPLKESLVLPLLCIEKLNSWAEKHSMKEKGMLHIVGTADGTGVVESIEMGLDRAMLIKNRMIKYGWKEDRIELSGGQRNQSNSIQNRCVVLYFE